MKKTMKRSLCLALTLALLFSLTAGLAVGVAAEGGATEPATGKTASGTCGETVTYSYYDATPGDQSPSGVLTISGVGAMYDYKQVSSMSVDTPWYNSDYRFDIQKVVILPGVTSIGSFAFYNLTKCTEAVIPVGVVSIGEWAFAYTAITKVDLPVTLKNVRHFAFFNSQLLSGEKSTCAGYPSIDNEKVGNTTTNYELINDLDNASKDNIIVEASGLLCTGIEWRYSSTSKTLTLSSAYDGVINKTIYEMIDMQMTLENPQPWPWSSYMSSIQNVYITKGISNIGQFVLAQLPALQSVTIGDHVETIEKNAFNSDKLLKGNLVLPEATTTIEDEAFLGCTGPLTVITPHTQAEVGATFSKVGNTGVTYQFADNSGSTPSTPTAPTSGLLAEGTIRWTYIPVAGMLFVEPAVSGATVAMPNFASSDEAPWNAYDDEIKVIYVQPGITQIGKYNFADLPAVTNVSFPSDGLARIYDYAFANDASLATVSFPNSVTKIYQYAFSGCNGLTSATAANSFMMLDRLGNEKLWDLLYGGGTTPTPPPSQPTSGSCGTSAVWNYDAATKTLTISGSGPMTNYASAAETPWSSYMTQIETLIVAESVSIVGSNALNGAQSLKNVSLPSTLMGVSGSAFKDCPSITYAYVDKTEGTVIIGDNNKDLTDHLQYKSAAASPTGGSCGTFLTWQYDAASKTLTISGTGPMTDYDTVALVPWSSYMTGIETVIVEEGVTTVGKNALNGASSLKTVRLPSTLVVVGIDAFDNCPAIIDARANLYEGTLMFGSNNEDLTSKLVYNTRPVNPNPGTGTEDGGVIPGTSLTWNYSPSTGTLSIKGTGEIPNYTSASQTPWAKYASVIEAIMVQDGITHIGDYAFANMPKVTDVHLPATLKTIGKHAFDGCTSLKTINLPSGLTSIGEGAFRNCSSLKKIEFPATLKEIGNEAFWGCSGLEEVIISSKSLTIGKDAFAGCTAIVKVILNGVGEPTVAEGNENLTDHYVTRNASGTLSNGVQWKVDRIEGVLTFFGEGEVVREDAWRNEMQYVHTVVFEEGITGIAANLLKDDLNVEHIEMDDSSITTIGEGAFQWCQNLESVTMPEGLLSLGKNAFAGCKSLTEITIPNTLTTLPEGAFKDCTALAKITMYNGKLLPLQTGIFSGCTGIQLISFNGSQAQWNVLTANADEEIKGARVEFTVTFTVKYVYVGGPLDGREVCAPAKYMGKTGEKFTVTVPSVAFYTPSATVVPSEFGVNNQEITIEFKPSEYTVTVEYVDAQGNVLHTATNVPLNYGESQKVLALDILGYTVRVGELTVNVDNGDNTVQFVYDINTYSYTVEYWNSRTNKLIKYEIKTAEYLSKVTLTASDLLAITGYAPADANAVYTIEGIKDNDQVIKVVYDPSQVTLTIKYVNDKGVEIATAKTLTVYYGDKVEAEAPVVTGMKAAAPVVIESFDGEETTITVTYEREEYSITINFVKDSLTGDKVYEPYTTTAKFEDKFVFDVTQFEQYAPKTGYEVKAPKLTIESVSEDATLTVVYTLRKISLTIHYVDEQGNKVADDFSMSYDYGTKVSQASPAVKGRTPELAVYIVDQLVEDVEKTIVYTRQSYRLTVHFYEAGTVDYSLFPDFVTTVKYGDSYVFSLSENTQYVNPAYTTDTLELDFGTVEGDAEMTITYTPKQLKLTVEYKNAEGTVVATDELTVLAGRAYEIPAKTLTGYKTTEVKSGVMGVEDATVVVELVADGQNAGNNGENNGNNGENSGNNGENNNNEGNKNNNNNNDDEKGNGGKVAAVIIIILVVLGGGGAAFYFLYLKKKPF